MASCGDEFSLLNDDDTNQHHHSNHRRHHQNLHHHQSFPPPLRFTKLNPLHSLASVPLPQEILASNGAVGGNASVGDEDDDDEDFNGAAFCSQADPKCTSTFHDITPFSGEDNVNRFVDESDPEKSMLNARNERKERDEVSDGGTPCSYKKHKLTGGGGSSGAGTSSCDYRKDREEWSDTAIACLLDAYMDKFTQLNRGNLRGRDWEEVAITVSDRCDKISKSVEQCKNKVDNLKKRYKLERHRMTNGGISTSHWPWFKKMEQIVGNSLSSKNIVDEDKAVAGSGTSIRPLKRSTTATSSPVAQITNMKSKSLSNPKWRRVVFKISGAALASTGPNNIDPKVAMLIAREVAVACRLGVEVAIVVGGRNFFCGDTWVTATGLDRCTAYQIGMMATVMNSILLQSAIEKMGIQTRLQSAFTMQEVAEPYSRQRAIRHLEKGRVVIFGGVGAGTGNPLFSTDTAAALRASEIHAEAVLKGTNVDGVYDCNSRDNNVIFQQISFRELVSRGATSMDMMALTFCEENGIPIVVFNLLEPGNISRALCGDQVGTLINETGRIS